MAKTPGSNNFSFYQPDEWDAETRAKIKEYHAFYEDEFLKTKAKQLKILRRIENLLKQFSIKGEIDPGSILICAYFRGGEIIVKHREIDLFDENNRESKKYGRIRWFQRIVLNIVREEKKRINKRRGIFYILETEWNNKTKQSAPLETIEQEEQRDICQNIVNKAWGKLSPEEQELLDTVIVKKIPYKKIQEFYKKNGEDISIVALRKRKQKALFKFGENLPEKLRDKIEQIMN